MPELLVELGCEELPAFEIGRAAEQLRDNVIERLKKAGLGFGEQCVYGTPRRLIVQIMGVEDRQEDSVKEMRGPALASSFDPEGKPTKALEGFCKGQGVSVSEIERRDDYVWVTKKVVGLPAVEVLKEAIPEAIRSLTFEKTMRWGTSRMRFARPIRWILASFGGKAIEFEIEGVCSGLLSRGHRFLAPEEFAVNDLASLLEGLRKRYVEPDATVREARIREGAINVAAGTPMLSDQLVNENAYLTEWPECMLGDFPEAYMSLPEPVLVTVMAKHERFFPVRNESGGLTNRFISVRNGGEPGAVLRGNQWVLNARFNDAKFFYDDDSRRTMNEFLERTARMTFAEGLGSIRQRADRLSALARAVALAIGSDEATAALALKAGLYAKADLGTGLVSELASLQGVIGGEYARREKIEDAVCEAIRCQYDLTQALHCKHNAVALAVVLADQLDKLAGYLGTGRTPTGSSDPFGLRRAASVLLEASRAGIQPSGGFGEVLEMAIKGYEAQGVKLDGPAARSGLSELLASRLESAHADSPHDVLQAALLDRTERATFDPAKFALRLKVASGASLDTEFVQAATRPINIVAAARKKGIEVPVEPAVESVDASKLDSAEGEALLRATREAAIAIQGTSDPAAVFLALKRLQAPINAFFEATMVMVEETEVRDARLTMLSAVASVLDAGGDMSKIVIDG